MLGLSINTSTNATNCPILLLMSSSNTMAMEIPVHILDAVSVSDISQSPRLPGLDRKANSSADDVSSTSHSDQEHGYQTDFTTPSSAGDMQPDEVEDFRDREYPQLKGKTYLDHGGTTVGRSKTLLKRVHNADMSHSCTPNP